MANLAWVLHTSENDSDNNIENETVANRMDCYITFSTNPSDNLPLVVSYYIEAPTDNITIACTDGTETKFNGYRNTGYGGSPFIDTRYVTDPNFPNHPTYEQVLAYFRETYPRFEVVEGTESLDPNYHCYVYVLLRLQQRYNTNFGFTRQHWIENSGLMMILNQISDQVATLSNDQLPNAENYVQEGDVVLFYAFKDNGERYLLHAAIMEQRPAGLRLCGKLASEPVVCGSIADTANLYQNLEQNRPLQVVVHRPRPASRVPRYFLNYAHQPARFGEPNQYLSQYTSP